MSNPPNTNDRLWDRLRAEAPDSLYSVSVYGFADALDHCDQLRLCSALQQWLTWVNDKPKGQRPLCLLCPHEFSSSTEIASVVTTTAYRDDPGVLALNAICQACREGCDNACVGRRVMAALPFGGRLVKRNGWRLV